MHYGLSSQIILEAIDHCPLKASSYKIVQETMNGLKWLIRCKVAESHTRPVSNWKKEE